MRKLAKVPIIKKIMIYRKLIAYTLLLSLSLPAVFPQKGRSAAPKKNSRPLPQAVNPTTTKSPEAKTAVERLKKTPAKKQKKEAVIIYNEDFVKGEELFVLNKPEEAIVYFEKSLESANVDPKVYIYLGVCYYQIEKYDKSLAVCVQGMAKEGSDKKILAYNAGNSCYAMGNYMRADASYAIALKEDENYSPAVLNRANAQLKLEHLGDARENYIKYLEMEPETPQRERIEEIIRLLEEEIARRANEKPELVNADFNIENEKMEIPEEPERVLADEFPSEKPQKEKSLSEIVHADSVAPALPSIQAEKKSMELVAAEKKAEQKDIPVIPELVGPDGEAPFIPPEQLSIAPTIVKTDSDELKSGGKYPSAGERVRIDDELRRFEEERKKLESEKLRLEEAKKAAEEEKLRLEEENRKKAEEEASRLAEENRRKAREEEERIAAQKRALEEERHNLEKAKMQAEFEAQKRALEEEKRKMEESRKAMEAEQQRIAAENQKRALEEELRKIEQAREEARLKAEEEARIKAEEEAKARKAEEEKQKAREEARKAAEEAKKAEEARKAEIESWPDASVSLSVQGGSNFTPDGDGHNDSISFVPEAQYLEEGLDSWNFSIYDPKGNLFRSIKGKGALPQKIEWDGKSDRGETVLSKNTYTAKLSVVPGTKDRLRLGKKSLETEEKIYTGLLLQVIIPGHEWKMVVNSINFVPNGALDPQKLTSEQVTWNNETLDEIAEQIKDHPGSSIVIVEGYANNISGTEKENTEELIPLSQMRSDAIVEELVKRGVSRDVLKSMGRGGANPLASQSDKANWYKNRRVEFRIKK